MANTKIQIDNTLVKGDKWYNLDIFGKKAGISVTGAPKTIAEINSGAAEVEVNLVEKDGKYYVWDKQEQKQGGGFKQLSPEQLAAKQAREDHTQRMIVAQNSVTNAVQYYQQREGTVEKVKVLAMEFYNLVINMSK